MNDMIFGADYFITQPLTGEVVLKYEGAWVGMKVYNISTNRHYVVVQAYNGGYALLDEVTE